jgi:hypothetical protein
MKLRGGDGDLEIKLITHNFFLFEEDDDELILILLLNI